MKISTIDLAWFAGLIEGEGCFTHTSNSGLRIRIQVQMTDYDVILRIQRIAAGSVYGPIEPRKKHHKPTWLWYTPNNALAVSLMKALLPLMGKRRAARITELLQIYDDRRAIRAIAAVRVEQRRKRVAMLARTGKYTHAQIAKKLKLERSTVTHILNGRYGDY